MLINRNASSIIINGKINMPNYSEQNILVVDDDLLVRRILKKYISSLGYYVDTAEDGRSALEMLRSFS